MNKVLLLTLGVILLSAGLVFAQQSSAPESMQSSVQAVDADNKFCPVSGRPIGVMGPGAQQVYNNKIYHLCCGGCISTFQSNPEKYSKIADSKVVPSAGSAQ